MVGALTTSVATNISVLVHIDRSGWLSLLSLVMGSRTMVMMMINTPSVNKTNSRSLSFQLVLKWVKRRNGKVRSITSVRILRDATTNSSI